MLDLLKKIVPSTHTNKIFLKIKAGNLLKILKIADERRGWTGSKGILSRCLGLFLEHIEECSKQMPKPKELFLSWAGRKVLLACLRFFDVRLFHLYKKNKQKILLIKHFLRRFSTKLWVKKRKQRDFDKLVFKFGMLQKSCSVSRIEFIAHLLKKIQKMDYTLLYSINIPFT